MNNTLLHFRKMLPNRNNISARALSKRANENNARRIHVNAQVTAMTTLLESMYIISFFVVLLCIHEKQNFVTLIQGMGLYLVLLPYVFLMNTSHNKNRIMVRGWKNVFKNIIGCSKECINNSGRNDGSTRTRLGKHNKDFYNRYLKTVSTSNSHIKLLLMVPTFQSSKNKISNQQQNGISFKQISKNHISYENNSNEEDKCSRKPKVPKVTYESTAQSSSNELSLAKENRVPVVSVPFDGEPSSSSGLNSLTTEGYNPVDTNYDRSQIKEVAKMIIDIMIHKLEDEQLYIEYFKKLVDLKSESKNENLHLNCLNEHLWKDHQITKDCLHKNKKMCTKKEHCKMAVQSFRCDSSSPTWEGEHTNINTSFNFHSNDNHTEEPHGERNEVTKDQTRQRKEHLTILRASCDIQEKYEVLLEKLIDLEESFVVNN